ncbi:MAG: IS66-like element accessory protein TnpA [Janthinobacterium lividum]
MVDGRIEIITGRDRRRRWSIADKLRIVAEAEEPRACFAHVADRNEVSRGLLWNWRAQVRRGTLRMEPPTSFLPVHLADMSPATRSRPAGISPFAPSAQSTAPADQIEIELPDGSRLRVGSEVSLVALRRVMAVLRG